MPPGVFRSSEIRLPLGEGIPQKGRYTSTLSNRTPPQSARRADSSPYTGEPYAVRFYRLRKAYTKSPQQSGVFRFAEGSFSSFTL